MRRLAKGVLAYFRRHEVADDSTGEWVLRMVKEAEQLEDLVRTLSTAVPCPEPYSTEVKRLMREARAARRRAFNTPPGPELRIAVLQWHYSLAKAVATVQLPYSMQAMKGRQRVVDAGEKRRDQRPRNAAARMKRMGKSRKEASEYLKNGFDIPPRTRTSILAEIYGRAATRREK